MFPCTQECIDTSYKICEDCDVFKKLNIEKLFPPALLNDEDRTITMEEFCELVLYKLVAYEKKFDGDFVEIFPELVNIANDRFCRNDNNPLKNVNDTVHILIVMGVTRYLYVNRSRIEFMVWFKQSKRNR